MAGSSIARSMISGRYNLWMLWQLQRCVLAGGARPQLVAHNARWLQLWGEAGGMLVAGVLGHRRWPNIRDRQYDIV